MAIETFIMDCLRSLPDADATAALCSQYEPLARKMAQLYCQWLEQREELEQVARLGLVKACRTFDLARWTRHKDGAERLFARHATWCVRHELAEHVGKEPNPLRLPTDVIFRLSKLRKVTLRLSHELGRAPTFEEIVDAGVIPKDKYRDQAAIIMHMLAYDKILISLDEETASDALTPEEILIERETQHELERQR